jgi:hypothetical protein
MEAIGGPIGLIIAIIVIILFTLIWVILINVVEIGKELKRIEKSLRLDDIEETLQSIEQVLKSQAFSKEDK